MQKNIGKRSHHLCFFFRLLLPVTLVLYTTGSVQGQAIPISKSGKALCIISISDVPSPTLQYAAAELKKYLDSISGGAFVIYNKKKDQTEPSIELVVTPSKNEEDYTIATNNKTIVLTGNSDRAILYAVYDLLHRLGCEWLAPGYSFYSGSGEFVPHVPTLVFDPKGTISEHPRFSYRKLDVEEGRTHTAETLKKMIDWMPKARYNILMVPLNLNGNGRVSWDKWRDELSPEIKKRGLLLEVGGHGYQNFIHAKMENASLFIKHPDWFGKDSACHYTASDRLVFNTTNADAVNYFLGNIASYVRQHPEIDIFEIWPPDVGRWADCAEWKSFGTAEDRHALLVNKVDSMLKTINSKLKLEIIAYAFTLLPPQQVKLNPDIIVDICPINQSFERPLGDPSSVNNVGYARAINAWRKTFSGTIGLYSYYRKYAWRSAPNVIPHYIQRDMQWCAKVPLQGISTYAEPGDWFTYELNHYTLAQLAWDPAVDIDSLSASFFRIRYGEDSTLATAAYADLEKIVPVYGSIPFTSLKSAMAIGEALKTIRYHQARVTGAIRIRHGINANNFSRLALMYEYAERDLQIQYAIASKASIDSIHEQIGALVSFLQANLDKGVFLLTGDNDLSRFMKKYGLSNQGLAE